ncbi:MAG: hypothetical protein ABF330_00895 [Lentimonas sp.]
MQIRIIWDHGDVRVLRRRRSGIECIAQGTADDADALVTFLKSHYRQLAGCRMAILLDHPFLDHRLERIPNLSPKLQRQLLEQRHQKVYGKELRYWRAVPLEFESGRDQQVQLLASFPSRLNDLIAAWALSAGIYLEGLFSLPAAVAAAASGVVSESGIIRRIHMGEVAYLVALNAAGKSLFFTRAGAAGEAGVSMARSAERLALFVEQEFGLDLSFSEEAELATADELAIDRLFRLLPKQMLNICAPRERRRQASLRIRLRLFATLVVGLLLTAFFIQPRLAEKQRLVSERNAFVPEIRGAELELQKIKAALAEERVLRQVVAFCRNRSVEKAGDSVPSPLLVLVAAIVDVLSPKLELDLLDCRIDAATETLRVQLRGRPLTPDLDLSAQLAPLREGLENQGWEIGELNIDFVSSGNGNSRFSQRGRERSFEVGIVLRAKPLNLENL